MKKLLFPAALLLVLFCSCSQKKSVSSFVLMDTYMTIQSYGKNSAKANEQVKKEISQLENLLSTTKTESDIYKINHSVETRMPVSPVTAELLNYSLEFANKTNGALNPALYAITSLWGFTTGEYKVPSSAEIESSLLLTDYKKCSIINHEVVKTETGIKLDLGAVGKGFAGDKAIEVLKANGINSALLDLGGNIQALGLKPDGTKWTIGIKNPWDGTVLGTIKINNKAVITSGGYERFFTGDDGNKYIHIFNPETGRPIENEISSVTVICDSGLYGDALSTSLFVMGLSKAVDFWKQYKDFEMVILTKDKKVYITKGATDGINLFNDSNAIVIE